MYLLLLTGGLASGKGCVRTQLAELGACTIDLDSVARAEQEAPEVLKELVAAFGAAILNEDGSLNRPALAQQAFASDDATARLNAICWPPTAERVEEFLATAKGLVVAEIPLLVESGALLERADEVLTLAAPEHVRLERAVARGMDAQDAQRRLRQQATDEQRAAISDTVLLNTGSLEDLRTEVRVWYERRHKEGCF